MSSTNQSPHYQKAHAKFLSAQTDEDKIYWLDEMIKECPKHKSAEKMLANLKTRKKKLLEKIDSQKKVSKSSKKPGIRKEDMQAVIVSLPKAGKSALLSTLTNAEPEISKEFNPVITTMFPEVGMIEYPSDVKVQLIEIPSVNSENFDKSIVNNTDVILILVEKLEQLNEVEKHLGKNKGKKIVVFNKSDKLSQEGLRKLTSTLKSKKYNFNIISTKTLEGLEELKNNIFKNFNKMRIYTKEPGKETTKKALILEEGKTVKDVAEKIFHGFSKNVREIKLWGPSSKFPAQVVGLNHKLRDLDIVEFKTR